jgi:hypothetical protein
MEIVQTSTGAWPWCMGMFGARFAPGFAVFVRMGKELRVKLQYKLFHFTLTYTFAASLASNHVAPLPET